MSTPPSSARAGTQSGTLSVSRTQPTRKPRTTRPPTTETNRPPLRANVTCTFSATPPLPEPLADWPPGPFRVLRATVPACSSLVSLMVVPVPRHPMLGVMVATEPEIETSPIRDLDVARCDSSLRRFLHGLPGVDQVGA